MLRGSARNSIFFDSTAAKTLQSAPGRTEGRTCLLYTSFTVRTIDTASESGWREEVVDLAIGGDKSGMTGSHGGGDLRLVEDFVRVLQGEQPSISCTNINDSLNGHLAVFRAEKSRRTGTVAEMPQL